MESSAFVKFNANIAVDGAVLEGLLRVVGRSCSRGMQCMAQCQKMWTSNEQSSMRKCGLSIWHCATWKRMKFSARIISKWFKIREVGRSTAFAPSTMMPTGGFFLTWQQLNFVEERARVTDGSKRTPQQSKEAR